MVTTAIAFYVNSVILGGHSTKHEQSKQVQSNVTYYL